MLNYKNERWLPIKGRDETELEGTQISDYGRVKSKHGNIIATHIINSGYLKCSITVTNRCYNRLIHRLVLEAFSSILPEYWEAKFEVNHIDGNKFNNNLTNLEWTTSKENKQHALQLGLYNKIFTTKNSLGKKHLPNTHSKYHNVSYDRARSKWTAGIRIDGKNCMQKRFQTEIEAAKHVNLIIDTYNLTDRPKNIFI